MRKREYKAELCEFGEMVWAKHKRIGRRAHRAKEELLSARAVPGIWFGIHEETGENLVAMLGARAPVIKVRTVARRLEDERWNKEALLAVEAEPRCPHPRMPESDQVPTPG